MTFFLQRHPGLRFHAQYNMSYNQFDLWLAQSREDMNGGWDLITKCELTVAGEEHKPGEPTPPVMKLSVSEAQALFDSLWMAGLRPQDWGQAPKDMSGVKDEVIAAQKEHIKDLRAVGCF